MNIRQLKRFVKKLSYKEVEWQIKKIDTTNGFFTLYGERPLTDPITKEVEVYCADEEFIYRGVTEMQLLLAIRDWIHKFEKHEADEWIVFDGQQPFNPHIAKVNTV